MSPAAAKKPVVSAFGANSGRAPEDDLHELDRRVRAPDDPAEIESFEKNQKHTTSASDGISVEMLEKLKKEFRVDENGDSESLEFEAFVEKCGAVLGANLSRQELGCVPLGT